MIFWQLYLLLRVIKHKTQHIIHHLRKTCSFFSSIFSTFTYTYTEVKLSLSIMTIKNLYYELLHWYLLISKAMLVSSSEIPIMLLPSRHALSNTLLFLVPRSGSIFDFCGLAALCWTYSILSYTAVTTSIVNKTEGDWTD